MKAVLITLDKSYGIMHYTSQLANALAKKIDVVVIEPIGADKHNYDNGIKVMQMPMGETRRNLYLNTLILNRPIRFLKTILDESPDIIHCTQCYPWLALLFLLKRRIPIATTIHDTHAHKGSFKIKEQGAVAMHIRLSNAVIVHGSKSQEELGRGVKSYIIPHGDYSFFLRYQKDIIKEEDNTILFFGFIRDYKGLEYLIPAFNKLLARYPNLKLIIAGEGDFEKYKSLIKDEVHFEIHNYYIPDQEVYKYFQRVSMVVLPYIEATQTGIIPIAFAFKKPVIATYVGDIPEVIDNGINGILVPPKDVDALATAISKLLLDSDLRARLAYCAYETMVKKLSWDVIADQTIKAYKEIIESNRKI